MTTQTPKSRPAMTGPVPATGGQPAGIPGTAPMPVVGSGKAPASGSEQQTQNDAGTGTISVSEEEWESERQLVASLAMLQELEAKVRI